MNNDLISREWIRQETSALKSHARSYQQITYATGYMCGLSVLEGRLADAPAVNAVEVTYCNECKYFEADTGFCYYHGHGMHVDDFCSMAERRNESE